MAVDLEKAWATLVPTNLNDVNRFETEEECRPSNLNFVLYYEIYEDACDDDDAVDDVAMQWWTHRALDFRVIDMFLC